MPMTIGEYKWRDRILLLVGWGTIFFTAVSNWALEGLPTEITERTGLSSWQTVEPYIHTILPIVVFFVPILVWAVLFIVPSFSLSKTLDKFQQEEVFWGLVFIFNLGLVSLIAKRFRESLFIEFLLISLVVVIVLWLFYRRISIDITKMVLCATLWIAIIIIRQTLPLLQDKIDFFTASWYTQVYILLMIITLIGSVFLPLIVLFDRRRRICSRSQETFERIPIWVWAAIFVLASLLTFTFFWIMENEFIGVIAMRVGSVIITLSVGAMLLRLLIKQGKFKPRKQLSNGTTRYVILLAVLLILYLVAAVRIGMNHLDIINPDGLYYLNIAWEYANGNQVIRGNWAPLLSWLIAPWISLGADPHKSYTLIVVIVGFIWILISSIFAKRVGLRRAGRLVVAAAIAVIILSNGLTRTTPDLLGAVFVLLYLFWITHPEFRQHPIKYGLLAGLSGALAYYSKSYNLPFILAHLFLTVLLTYFHKRQLRAIFFGTIISILIIGLCIAPWINALYSRYGILTISTGSKITYAKIGPGAEVGTCREKQLCIPPSDVLLHGEDQQPQYFPAYGWSPFDSLDSFRHQIKLMRSNIWNWATNVIFRFGPLLPLTLLVIGLGIIIFWKDHKKRFCFSWAFLTILLYASGYMLTFAAQLRYYLSILPLLVIASVFFLQAILDTAKGMISESKLQVFRWFSVTVLVIYILSLGHLDLIKYLLIYKHDPCLRVGAEKIASYLAEPMVGTDAQIYNIGYYTRIRTLGVVQTSLPGNEVDELLHKYSARTLVISRGSNLATDLVQRYGYTIKFESKVCEQEYLILGVPEW
jgi:hypothetical protein